jgi:hypothetical protein
LGGFSDTYFPHRSRKGIGGRREMIILGHTLPELRKTVVQLVFSVAAVLVFFIHFNPGITTAVVAVVVATFGVATVYNAKHNYDDISKSIMALVTAGVALYGFFHTFHTGDTERIIAIAGAILNVGAVFFIKNAGTPEVPR